MEKYNYLKAITKDAKEAISRNMGTWKFTDRLDLESMAKRNMQTVQGLKRIFHTAKETVIIENVNGNII